jgi:homoserine O-acetyltransferase
LAAGYEAGMPIFRSHDFELANGIRLAEVEIAYECYGEIADDKSNVILVTHGITSSHHATGTATLDRRRGWWSEVIGPEKVYDTTRYCIVSSNILGSSYGSTGPASLDPNTGKPYGTRFPAITFEDIVRAQHLLLQSLGVCQLVAVAGNCIGGFQAFQWAVTFPNFMKSVIAMDTGPKDLFDTGAGIPDLIATLTQDPNWNDGDYYAQGRVVEALTDLRVKTLKSYGFEDKLERGPDQPAPEAVMLETAREWAKEFDAHSLITLMRAWADFNVEDELHKVSAKIFYVLCDTDELFPASVGQTVMAKFRTAGVDATYHEVNSRLGHYATTEEPEKWTHEVEEFLRGLTAH